MLKSAKIQIDEQLAWSIFKLGYVLVLQMSLIKNQNLKKLIFQKQATRTLIFLFWRMLEAGGGFLFTAFFPPNYYI